MYEPDCCGECFDEFHYDDVGGYNPPCLCGCGRCRSCCEADRMSWEDEDYPDDDERPAAEPVREERGQ